MKKKIAITRWLVKGYPYESQNVTFYFVKWCHTFLCDTSQWINKVRGRVRFELSLRSFRWIYVILRWPQVTSVSSYIPFEITFPSFRNTHIKLFNYNIYYSESTFGDPGNHRFAWSYDYFSFIRAVMYAILILWIGK